MVKELGAPSQLVERRVPVPELAPHQVRIRAHAAGLNFADTLVIAGEYQVRRELPFIPGSECSGVVLETGDEVDGLVAGDHVVAAPLSGCFAEEVVADAHVVAKVPGAVPHDQAAGIPIAYGTAWHTLVDRGGIKPNEWVLVLGAGGGVGLAAIDVARSEGARVVAMVSSAAKADAAASMGAERVITDAAELGSTVAELTEGRGLDVVVDPVGGEGFDVAFRSLAWRGRYLVVGFASGTIPTLSLNRALFRGCDVRGVYWGRSAEEEPVRFQSQLAAVMERIAGGQFRGMPIHGVRPNELVSTLEALKSRTAAGKYVLRLAG
ncbi:MAG: NADPH:quinone oxidoreductase family protein [Actinomycetota bacterium]